MRKDRDPEQFLKGAPYLRKLIVECSICHARGCRAESAATDVSRGPIYVDLLKLFPVMSLDENLICEQCGPPSD